MSLRTTRITFEIGKALSRIAIVTTLVLTLASSAFAQAAAGEERAKPSSGPRRQLATIVFAGLGGAVIGLSTLSFYGRPQDNLRNIAIGGAFGIVAGAIYVTYKAANGSSDLYGGSRPQIENEFAMTSAANAVAARETATQGSPLALNLNFQF